MNSHVNWNKLEFTENYHTILSKFS